MRVALLPKVLAVPVAGLTWVLVGCGPASNEQDARPANASESAVRAPGTSVRETSVEARRAALLNRIRAADPQKATIERALINENNELGLILSRQTNLDDVSRLMKAMLTQMAEEFPNQDLTVIAYTPTEPPRTIGTGRLNARTREMTYEPVSVR